MNMEYIHIIICYIYVYSIIYATYMYIDWTILSAYIYPWHRPRQTMVLLIKHSSCEPQMMLRAAEVVKKRGTKWRSVYNRVYEGSEHVAPSPGHVDIAPQRIHEEIIILAAIFKKSWYGGITSSSADDDVAGAINRRCQVLIVLETFSVTSTLS